MAGNEYDDCVITNMAEEFGNVLEAAPQKPEAEEPMNWRAMMERLINLDTRKKALQKELNELSGEIQPLKQVLEDYFIESGIESTRMLNRTVYLHQQIYAGVADDAVAAEVAEELKSLNLSEFISVGTQALSAYIRDFVRDNPNFVNEKGDVIVPLEQILASLPGKLPELLKITNKTDIKIRR